MKQDYPSALRTAQATTTAAVDTTVVGTPLRPATKPTFTEGELKDKRTATTKTVQHKDGSQTLTTFVKPHYYQHDGVWKDIKTTVVEDKNAADTTNVFGRALGWAQSVVSGVETYKVEANSWQSRFAPSNDGVGMVRLQYKGQTVSLRPVGANDVVPTKSTDSNGKEIIVYKDMWPGIDVQYQLHSDMLKEFVLLKDANATTDYAFTVSGATLVPNAKVPGGYVLRGALDNKFQVEPLTVSLAKDGPISTPVTTQQFKNGTLAVQVDTQWLAGLSADNFPVTIDPTLWFDSGANGNYASYRSDGVSCGSSVCYLNVGTEYDSGWKYWRSVFSVPYTTLQGKVLLDASYHLAQADSSTASRYIQIFHASCLGYSCLDTSISYSSTDLFTPPSHDFNLTDTYKTLIGNNNWNAYMIIKGEEVNYNTFKIFDPDTSYVEFTYTSAPDASSVISPSADNQVVVTTQPGFTGSVITDADGDPVTYAFQISTGSNGSGMVVNSGRLTVPQWTVPNDVLQDGTTYYVQVITNDGYVDTPGPMRIFKVDTREGKDKTQTYDTLGPVDVNLATGNLSTSASSHSASALGGSLGVSLDYNSPVKSRPGLVGEYWNVPANYSGGAPSGTPQVTRVDQTIDFNWWLDSPVIGTITNDWFYGRWQGYFTAPKTGTYYFGSNADDSGSVYINNAYAGGSCYSGVCYGSAIALTAGQTVPIRAEYTEGTVQSYFHVYVKGAVSEQVIPAQWLQTGVRPVAQTHGLTGSYYTDDGTHNLDGTGKSLFMQRTDTLMNFYWGTGSPGATGPTDFMTRWAGYFTAPVTGTYQFGTNADDGTKVKVNGTTVLDNWSGCCSLTYGTGVFMTAGQTMPIGVDFVDTGGVAQFILMVKGAVAEQIVPASWLSPKAQVLPDGWNLGIDPDGNLSYDRIKIGQTSATLTDSTGSNHEYTWTGSGYKPPVNEDGQLAVNTDGTYTLQDTDGRNYVFGADGLLKSVTTSLDDRKPAALSYEYGGTPAKIQYIRDGVDPTGRYAAVYYSGDTNCGTIPSGYTAAPSGMLCALKTNDGRATYFYYDTAGDLARIAEPGSEYTDYQYDSLHRIVSIRDSLANDAVAAGVRTNDTNVLTEVGYDLLGRATTVKQPAPTTGATRTEHTIQYLPGTDNYPTTPGYYGATQQHITGMTEPNGFARRVEYDSTFRTTTDTDIANLSAVTTWDPVKDLQYSITDATGLKNTIIYDDEDRPIDAYGPAPSSYYGTDRKPTSTYASQVPRTETKYDEGISGTQVAWYNAKGKSLFGAPKLHTTGIVASDPTATSRNFSSNAAPITPDTGMDGYGFSATAKIRFPQTGTYTFRLWNDDGAKLWIDDNLFMNNWDTVTEATATTARTATFNAVAGTVYRFRLDYIHFGNAGLLDLWTAGPGITDTSGQGYGTNHPSFLSPDYSLTTSTTVYDATLGNSKTVTAFGSTPELALAQSTSVDPTGLNLTTSSTYETQGATGSFMRQTAKYLPGANTSVASTATQYTHYGATDTKDNPCTSGTTEAYKQAGFMKLKTEPDPDGTGSQAGRITETIYDDAGRVVATRYNTDSWTCTTYDTRGRVTQTTVPAYNGNAARTIENDYAVGGSPLVTTSWDGNGWIVVWSDLLGRTVKYRDVYDDETTSSYDSLGKLTGRSGPLGSETLVYDTYNRLTQQKLDGTTYATVTYDAFSRVDYVDYNNAGSMRLTYGRDSLGRTSSQTYRMGDGTTTVSDTVNRTQSGQIVNDIVKNGSNELWYTYGYDGADRLTSMSVGANTFSYGFGTQNTTTCGTGNNKNPNSGKNSNRTTQTINSVTTNFCYDYADRLIGSSDALYNTPTYDTHGNMTQIGTGTTPLHLFYDSSDRSTGYEQYNSSTTGVGMYYDRDVQGRIIARYKNTITAGSWANAGTSFYHFTGSGDTPDYVRDNSWNIVEKNISLPGGVMLTIKPQETVTNNQKQYSLPNIHGDTLLTTNAAGTNTSTGNGPLNAFTYDAFGNVLTGSVLPANTHNGSYGWVGQHQKITEVDFALKPIPMGARVYLPGIGRFTQVDPVEGGVENSYIYPADPINKSDLTGEYAALLVAGALLVAMSVASSSKEYQNNPSTANLINMGLAVAPAGGVWGNTTIKALTSSKEWLRNGNNWLRIGPGKDKLFRISIGPQYKHYKTLKWYSKLFAGTHWHFQKSKAGIDINWLTYINKDGKRVTRTIKLWGDWR